MVIVAERMPEVVFAASEKLTCPLPEPLLPEVIVTHEALENAVQLQLAIT